MAERIYPVNESQSFLGSIIGSASKKAVLGKTLQSQSINFGNLMSRMSDNNLRNSNNKSAMAIQDARKC